MAIMAVGIDPMVVATEATAAGTVVIEGMDILDTTIAMTKSGTEDGAGPRTLKMLTPPMLMKLMSTPDAACPTNLVSSKPSTEDTACTMVG